MKRKVVLSAGGTGGHLFPAQSLAEGLPDWDILFAAGGLSSNRFFDRERFAFEEIECATFRLSKPLQMILNCGKIYKGVKASRRLLRHYKPNLVVGFGSFYTLPVLIAAWIEKIPFILHEQNAIPGKVNRLFSQFAHSIAITFPATRHYLKKKGAKKAVEVIFPLRKKRACTAEESWKYFGLLPGKPTLLVFGGSQGAEQLNRLFLGAIDHVTSLQVLHFTGSEERTLKAKKKYDQMQIPACVKSFERHIDMAMQIADLAITRAGAATIEELIASKLPALLIPYPYATDDHQSINAAHFVSQVKGGNMYKEAELNPAFLAEIMMQLLVLTPELKANIELYKKQRPERFFADYIASEFNGN